MGCAGGGDQLDDDPPRAGDSAACRTDCPDWQAYEKAKSEEYRQRQERHEYENYKADTIRKTRKRKREGK